MQSVKTKIVSNFIIIVVILSVFIVGFLPQKSITISSGDSYSAIYRGDVDSSSVALMFNVYENSEIVSEIIKVLKENNVLATFFVGGCYADDNPKMLKEILDNGFELGNHGYYHKDHKKLSELENYNEINNCHKIVYGITGYEMNLFAPPSGSFSKNTLKATKSLNYYTIMWSRDTIDWRDNNVELIIKRATEKTTSGDLILMHPKKHTLEALPKIIEKLKSKNLNLTTVSTCVFGVDKL